MPEPGSVRRCRCCSTWPCCGWLGWPHLVLGGLAGFALGAAVSLVLLVAAGADRHTAFPFGSWMVLSAVLGAVAGPSLLPALA
ncbi:A24 family peptidase [Desertihabitans aurantiacus]|uniref:hypothetical protein n=1 Tax=Desertihabitans aurantiacus TaxID=2282477 RepID=UPI0013001E36|nr:hypothetical protein [Desertihabitans aurantiacus]